MTCSESYGLIPVSRGLVCLVSIEDFATLLKFKWTTRNDKRGYRYPLRYVNGKAFLLHREILGLPKGRVPLVDHKNMNTLDNRRENLRIADLTQNNANSKIRKDNTTGFKGVSKTSQGRFRADIRFQGRKRYLGTRDSAFAAFLLYKEAADKYFGEFARY